MQYNIAAFIGRFQPFHKGHLTVIGHGLAYADYVVVGIGSANSSRCPRNPWTFEERKSMIVESIPEQFVDNVIIVPVNDMASDESWEAQVQALVYGVAEDLRLNSPKIALIGHSKDRSSYYLKKFPMWESINVPNVGQIDATTIRTRFFMGSGITTDLTPKPVQDFMREFTHTQANHDLYNWFHYDSTYNPKQYDINVVCADPVVTQSGHILLVQRKDHPGQGLWALPGGHKNINETCREAAIRELREETQISDSRGRIPPAILSSYIVAEKMFDDPNRSSRATVITMAYHFKLPDSRTLMSVKGDDDAERAEWVPLGSIDPRTLFEDHAKIIEHFLGNVFGN